MSEVRSNKADIVRAVGVVDGLMDDYCVVTLNGIGNRFRLFDVSNADIASCDIPAEVDQVFAVDFDPDAVTPEYALDNFGPVVVEASKQA